MKTGTAPLPPLEAVKVLDQLRERIRYLHYSLRTEEAYVHWVRGFIRFHGLRHPSSLAWISMLRNSPNREGELVSYESGLDRIGEEFVILHGPLQARC